MHTRRVQTCCAILSAVLLAGALQTGYAFPGFARKYGFECTMCHVQFPKLNDFGQRYRDNGYQVPGQEDMDQSALEGLPPLALRTSVGYVSHTVDNDPEDSDLKEFNLGGVDVLFGGLLGRDIGFFGIYTPRLDPAKGNDTQSGKLEMANVLFNNLGRSPIDLRIGRFEPGFLGFSAKRTFTFSGYEVYDFAGATDGQYGGFALSDTQEGVELSAHLQGGWHGVAGWVNGSQNHGSDKGPKDLYTRIYKVFGEGEGQTAGQRLGVMFYHGKARPGDEEEGPQYSFDRYGADLAVNLRQTSFLLQYLKGSDDRGFTGRLTDYDWKGGFVEVDHAFREDILGFGRYDWVSTPDWDGHDIRTWVLGSRWNLQKSLAVHLEYADRRVDDPGGPSIKSKDVYLRLDWAL